MNELKKEPEKYKKAREVAQKTIVDTVKNMPQPIISVEAGEVSVQVPDEFIKEIRDVVSSFNQWAEGKIKATEDAYNLIMKKFRENIAEDIKSSVRTDQSSFDSVIESAILRATSEFTSALSNIKIEEIE